MRHLLSLRDLASRLGLPLDELKELEATAGKHFRPYVLKKSGRSIDEPTSRLMLAQRRVYENLLRPLQLPDELHGGIARRSPRTNAERHCGARSVLRVDIKSFFPTVSNEQVYRVWSRRLCCGTRVSQLLTRLTTFHRRLPQGAPTSMALANLVLLDADEKIRHLAAEQALTYTRYVDDLIFSGDDPRLVINCVAGVLAASGFRVSRKKLEVIGPSRLKEVTGLAVNPTPKRGPSVSRRRVANIRAAVRQLLDFEQGSPQFETELRRVDGRIRHVAQTNPGTARRLEHYKMSTLSRDLRHFRVRAHG